jgi:hypothetical protein
MDDDNDIDVLGSAFQGHEFAWWENDGFENFMKHTIALNDSGAACVYAVDFDDDTDIDVLGASSSKDKIDWWESDLIGIKEGGQTTISDSHLYPTVMSGKINLPGVENFKLYDIMGREINDLDPGTGIYFLEVEGILVRKIIKFR